MKKTVSIRLFSILLVLLLCVSCQSGDTGVISTGNMTQTSSGTVTPLPEGNPNGTMPAPSDAPDDHLLNGVPIEKYCIVYDKNEADYNHRAATYIQSEIEARTGHRISVKENDDVGMTHEILVGETSRQLSHKLDANTQNTQFAIAADTQKIALEGDYFVIAAAAYFFVETYIPQGYFDSVIPQTTVIHEPIQKEAKNFIFLIGDGMGIYQTLLYDIFDAPKTGTYAYSDGEDLFYGYLFPHQGYARTNSLSGVTDSAAAGTALASGYKTVNGYIGRNSAKQDVRSLTELAALLGKATAVMSTEPSTGATPASFSAHAANRNDSADITVSQTTLRQNYGTIINCNFDYYSVNGIQQIESKITATLNSLSADEDGFFLMYEEAHIDKHCHSNDKNKTFYALMRFNQAIGRFMEYAFYHPDTFVLITADHETGGLLPNGSGSYSYSHGNHSAHYVPVFAYGMGSEVFHDLVIENTQIPKTYASMMGSKRFGDANQPQSLIP